MTHATLAVFGLGGGELLIICVALLLLGLLLMAFAVVTYIIARSLSKRSEASAAAPSSAPAPPAPTCGKQVSEHANLAGSQFRDVNLTAAEFDDVNLTSARFHNANLSNITITAAQMGGAVFKHIGPPPGPDGKQERQRPVRFEEMMLCDSTFLKVDLSNVRVTDCNLTGMTINGVLVTDLLAAYQMRPGG